MRGGGQRDLALGERHESAPPGTGTGRTDASARGTNDGFHSQEEGKGGNWVELLNGAVGPALS